MKSSRNRLQIDLAPRHQRLLRTLGDQLGSGSDSETTRRVLDVVDNIGDSIRSGYKLAVVGPEDEHPDAVPELTRAFRPEMRYTYLMLRPHAWRRQLSFKGRRLTVGQFLTRMRIEGWTIDRAAEEFELPLDAAYEAVDYGDRHRALIEAEDTEEARVAKNAMNAAASR